MFSPGACQRPVKAAFQSMCGYLPSPGLPVPSFYFYAGCRGQEVHIEGPRYVMSSNCPINYRSPVPHLCHLI